MTHLVVLIIGFWVGWIAGMYGALRAFAKQLDALGDETSEV